MNRAIFSTLNRTGLMNSLPLEGVKVVDLTAALSGLFRTQILADFGAEVNKIEPPETGDFLRAYGPPYVNGESLYFLLSNRNKRSITLNLKSKKGIEILHKMVSEADVVVENYRPDVKYKLQIAYQAVEKHPDKRAMDGPPNCLI
jgi:crotonobetainyl-CoA:carnitine CoA-transferase CaiB-like acyl-CoA transferase